MRGKSGLLLGLGAVMALTACGEGHVSKREAKNGWRSARMAMQSAGVSSSISLHGKVTDDGVSGVVEGTFSCDQGGELQLVASGEVTEDKVGGEMSLEFVGCKADDTTNDGVIDFEATVDENGVRASYRGELTWTGKAEGSCVVDAHANVNPSGLSISFGGNVCGFDWSDLR